LAAGRDGLGGADLAAWLQQGQPKVVLKVADGAQLDDVVRQARATGLPTEVICDAGRTQVSPGTQTCCAIGPADGERIDTVTAGLSLL
jgi:peptidyl-tRNA hydrolase, PTH2 family